MWRRGHRAARCGHRSIGVSDVARIAGYGLTMTIFRPLILFLLALTLSMPAMAEETRVTLGFGRLYSNDRLGDGKDRWRTGSWSLSVVSGYGWNGARPTQFGDIVELRFRTDIIAPRALSGAGSDDRPYVGAVTYGMHSHWAALGGELSAGLDVTMTGPQTGLSDLHDRWHDRFSAPRLSDEVVANQIGDAVYPSVTVEYGLPLHLSDRALVRPFAEVQAGVEQIARIGADVILGPVGQADLLIRDQPTGHLYRGTRSDVTGLSLVAGADWARIGDSRWLPSDRGVAALDERWRARIGAFVQPLPGTGVFFGLTWLSEEFEGQPEGQLLGSLSISYRF